MAKNATIFSIEHDLHLRVAIVYALVLKINRSIKRMTIIYGLFTYHYYCCNYDYNVIIIMIMMITIIVIIAIIMIITNFAYA